MGQTQATPSPPNFSELPQLTKEEVSKHTTARDLWISIGEYIYDVSNFLPDHPGGRDILLKVAGRDATEDFEEAEHGVEAREMMAKYRVGRLVPQLSDLNDTKVVKDSENKENNKEKQKEIRKEKEKSIDPKVQSVIEGDKKKQTILILYGSQKGTAQGYAEQIAHAITETKTIPLEPKVLSMEAFDPEDLSSQRYAVFLVSTYENGTPPNNAKFMCSWLKEACQDYRVGKEWLIKLRFTVFGLGDSLYEDNYNVIAKKLNKWLISLDAQSFCPLGLGDASISRSDLGTSEKDFHLWLEKEFLPGLTTLLTQGDKPIPSSTAPAPANDDEYEYDDEDIQLETNEPQEGEELSESVEVEDSEDTGGEKVVDLEDLGQMLQKQTKNNSTADELKQKQGLDASVISKKKIKKNKKEKGPLPLKEMRRRNRQLAAAKAKREAAKEGKEEEDDDKENKDEKVARPMLTPALRKNLSKQGYKIIGSHSGVKICRWTKAMLRGRGGCYKHTFYGIQSYQCMEMTPSLACANKCVFCWRHHTNPVGKEWRWEVNQPKMILDDAIAKHQAMIKQMKGVPGVQPERLEEAKTIKHCALSLVGEPIMYPHINEYVRLLHEKKISSFMVTNAQFPDRIEQMDPVTQLYVSIDASTQDSLKKIDRPLFKDFWERYIKCLEAVKHKKGRTVYRLTLVKGFNTEEIAAYARLVGIGLPSFIEIKGVTFCGASSASDLTMKNVPFHEEVRAFSDALCKYLEGEYELACEHVHSCCVLIAHKKFKVNGKWHTWIDYEKFHELQNAWHESGGKKEFDALDYMEVTPDWAVYGNTAGGFDPQETRWHRKEKKKDEPESSLPTYDQDQESTVYDQDSTTSTCCSSTSSSSTSSSTCCSSSTSKTESSTCCSTNGTKTSCACASSPSS